VISFSIQELVFALLLVLFFLLLVAGVIRLEIGAGIILAEVLEHVSNPVGLLDFIELSVGVLGL